MSLIGPEAVGTQAAWYLLTYGGLSDTQKREVKDLLESGGIDKKKGSADHDPEYKEFLNTGYFRGLRL